MGLFSRTKEVDEATEQESIRQRRKLDMRLVTINRRIDKLEVKLERLDEDMDEVYERLGIEEEEEEGGEEEDGDSNR